MLPVTNLVFNFTPPASEDQPALLSFSEVTVLFQKVNVKVFSHFMYYYLQMISLLGILSSSLSPVFVPFQFGSALQHLLTTVPYTEASGQTNIEWDAVEVCSNFMQNW